MLYNYWSQMNHQSSTIKVLRCTTLSLTEKNDFGSIS